MSDWRGWCQTHYALLADGGTWVVPRSSLSFQKDAKHTRLRLIAPLGPLSEAQQSDFEAIREQFGLAGIGVTRSGAYSRS